MKIYNCFENISQEFRLKSMDKTRNYISRRNKSKLIDGRKHKKVCATLNYIEHFLILGSAITGCISISPFTSLVGILLGIIGSTAGLKNF